MTATAASSVGGVSLRGFLAWWGRELASLLPDRLVEGGLSTRSRTVVLWRREQPEIARYRGRRRLKDGVLDLAATRPPWSVAGPVILRFPTEAGLARRITLPAAVEGNLSSVLRFEIDRLTPWPADRVAYAFRPAGPGPEPRTIAVDLIAVPRATLDAAMAALGRLGIVPTIADLAGTDPAAEPVLDLLGAKGGRRDRRLRHIAFALGALFGIPAAFLGGWLAWNLIERLHDLDLQREQVARAKESVASVSALQAELRTLAASNEFIAERRAGVPSASLVVETLSRDLPDGVWLTELSIEGRTVRLVGYADDASPLIAILEDSPLFAGAAFAAPSVRDHERGQERFTVTADIVDGPGGVR
jgi:general secretion pathway protein L